MKLLVYGARMKKVSSIFSIKLFIKKHFYILILLLLTILFFNNLLVPGKILNNIHHINDLAFENYNLKEALSFRTLHLWTPYFYSGTAFMAIPEYYIFDLNFIYVFLFRDIYLAMNLALISYSFIAGIGMYSLVYSIKKNQKIAFIAALIYMFNGFLHSFMLGGHINILEGYALLPLAFLFAYKALTKKEFVLYSAIAGIFLALQILAGSMIFFLYTSLLIGLLFLFNLIRKNFKKVIAKTILVALIVFFICIVVSSIKLLPSLEFSKMSSRSGEVSKTEFLGEPIKASNIFSVLASNIGFNGFTASVGITGFILLLFSFKTYKKRIVLFCILLAIFAFLAASGTFIADLLYKFAPGFGQMRHIERALVLFVFSASILAAFGYSNLILKLKKYSLFKKYEKIFFVFIVLLIVTESILLQKIPSAVKIQEPEEIPILNYINQDKSDFRTVNLALKTFIGASGYNYNAQLGIPSVKGGGGIWINDYIEYLAVAEQYNPSRLWGILNTKYAIADQEINMPNLKFIKKFSGCKECIIWEAGGPYLYENENFLPRGYIAGNAALVLSDNKNLVYSLLLNKNFNPRNTVVIVGNDIEKYTLNDLNKYKLIILNKKINQNNLLKLKNYADSGGIVLPDIFSNKNAITNEELEKVLSGFEGSMTAVEIPYYSPNKIEVDVKDRKGFLVLSERYAYFPGWEAKADGKELEILKANNVISSIYLEGSIDSITLEYKPKTFKYGLWISSISCLFLIVFFLLIFIKKKKETREKN